MRIWFAVSVTLLFWISCRNPVNPERPSEIPGGGAPLVALGSQIELGSASAYAKMDEESPRPTVTFTYNFFMDSTETTQGAYALLMGRNPVVGTRFGKGPGHPVYNVSFYDAALYCNARSKREGRDTVYAYTGRKQDAGGRTYELVGLAIRYEREGYRLPTEAEWEFAARGGVVSTFPWGENLDSASASQTGWYTGNSGGQTHPAGALPSNRFGLKDMLGNVMEWVNDWKGPYAAVSLRDFLGNRDPGLVAERVVKGGAFSYDIRFMRYSGRSANYPTLSSAAVEYVGFRCVLGRIQNGQYLSGGGAFAGMPPVTVYPGALQSLLGHNKAKLAFVNTTPSRRTLCYADFTENPVTVHEFLDDSAVFAPVISPNGEWVAYGNTYEGDAGPGVIRVRGLRSGDTVKTLSLPTGACLPRWWADPASGDTMLVYATSCRDNMETGWMGESTHRIRMAGGAVSGIPELISSGGYHDGLSGDGNWLATGYRRLKVKNRRDGLERVLFTGTRNGKPAGDTSQVCNVSMHPQFNASPEMMLLDFGFTGQSAVAGRPYRQHEVLFRVDTGGSVLRWYGAPAGYVAWQDAEWSNHVDYAVGLGEDQGGNFPAVVGLTLKDSVIAVLATGTMLRQPGMWVKPGVIPGNSGPGVDDSMGRYNEPSFGSDDFSMKMKVFWLQRDSGEVACLGSSHVVYGLWPQSFSHYHAINLGYTGAGTRGIGEMLRRYVLPHGSRLKAVVVEVHPGWFFTPGGELMRDYWPTKMGATLGYAYDRSHYFWSSGVPPYMDSLMQDPGRFSAYQPFDARGAYDMPSGGWGPSPPLTFATEINSLPDRYVSENLSLFDSLAKEAGNQGVLFVMTLLPQSPLYKGTPFFGKYGPDWASGRSIVFQLEDLCAANANCRFYDAFRGGNNDYDSLMFMDEDHLSGIGARQLSRRLDSLIFEAVGP